MSRPHIRGPGYSGSMGAPGYEVPYASNYDYENQFFGPSAGGNGGGEVFAGVSLPGFLMPPIGAYEGFQDARQGKLQLPGLFGAMTPSISIGPGAGTSTGPGSGGARSQTDWSGVAKVAVVAGAALALYFIFRSSEGAKPVAKKLGGIAEKIISARTGGASSRAFSPKRTAMLARMVEST